MPGGWREHGQTGDDEMSRLWGGTAPDSTSGQHHGVRGVWLSERNLPV